MIVETELKLELPPDSGGQYSRALLERLQPGGHARGVTRKLRSTYFDTPELDLARRGMALRVRKVGGHWVQTLKAPAPGKSGLQNFEEYESELLSDQPSLGRIGSQPLVGELRDQIWPKLRPLFETDIERTAWRLPFKDSQIELAWDRGHIRAGKSEEPVQELEIELKSGTPDALFQAAEELLEVVPFRLGHSTKAARGYALAAGKIAMPQKAAAIKLAKDQSTSAAFERIVTDCVAQMQANERAILAGGHEEAVHQFRVALRRLRAIVGTYRDLIDDTVFAIWSIDLRWAQRAFGPARDYDVLVTETLSDMMPNMSNGAAFQQFRDVADAARAEARQKAVQALSNPRYAAMQLHIYRTLCSGAWRRAQAVQALNEPVRAFAQVQLQAQYKRIRRLGDRWRELDHAELHRLRILGKKLRYVAMAFSSLFKGKTTRQFLGRLEALQDCLGVLNDALIGQHLVKEVSQIADASQAVPTAELQRIQGAIEGWQAHAIHVRLGEFERVWEDFAAAKRFWRS